MAYIPQYAKGKRNPASVTYPDPRLRSITESTYGCVIYQEQLMEIAKQMAGFSPARADDLRKAIGKKKRDLMATIKEEFLAGLQGLEHRKTASPDDLWSLMEAAADYSFNRSHAACYALISYRTAWLRANYPAEYMAALISTVMSTKDKVPFFVNRCDEMGIEVLPPDVNASDHGFVVSGKSIRFGLDAVKNVGHAAVQAIISARSEGGEFTSIYDFCERVDNRAVNKRAVECLIKCGALDSTGGARKGMLEALPMAARRRPEGPGGLPPRPGLDLRPRGLRRRPRGFAVGAPSTRRSASIEYEKSELLRLEKETLGTFLSSHPLADVARRAAGAGWTARSRRWASRADGSFVTVGGIVSEFKRHKTKRGDPMAFATLDDVEGQVEMLVLGKAYMESTEFLGPDAIVVITGRLDHQERGQTKLVATEVELLRADRGRGRPGAQGPGRRTADRLDRRLGVRPDADRRAEGGLRELSRGVRGGARDETREGHAPASLRRRLPGQAARRRSKPSSTP